MSSANDLVINSNTNGIILKKGTTLDDYKFRLSSDSTSFGSGASSIGLNVIVAIGFWLDWLKTSRK